MFFYRNLVSVGFGFIHARRFESRRAAVVERAVDPDFVSIHAVVHRARHKRNPRRFYRGEITFGRVETVFFVGVSQILARNGRFEVSDGKVGFFQIRRDLFEANPIIPARTFGEFYGAKQIACKSYRAFFGFTIVVFVHNFTSRFMLIGTGLGKVPFRQFVLPTLYNEARRKTKQLS